MHSYLAVGHGIQAVFKCVCVCVCARARARACMSEAGEGVKLHSYLHIVFAVLQYKRIYLFSLTLGSAV